MTRDGNKRFRLTPEEEEIILHRREQGSVPAKEMVQYDRIVGKLGM